MNLNKFFIFLLIGIICSVSVVSAADVNDDGFENTFDADFYYVDDSVYDDFDYDSFVDDDYEVMGKLVSDIIELPRHIDVEDSYFMGQYFPTKVELPCYPPSS